MTSVASELSKYDLNKKYPYDQLKAGNPEGVDPSNKEVGLGCIGILHSSPL